MLIANILGSFFWGASIARILTDYLVNVRKVNFYNNSFSESIPSFSAGLAQQKTYDNIYILLLLFATIAVFLINLFLLDGTKNQKVIRRIGSVYLAYSLLLFFETHFVSYSGTRSLFIFTTLQSVYILTSRFKFGSLTNNPYILGNGFFLGFFLLILTNSLTTSFTIPLGFLIGIPLIFSVLGDKKILRSSAFLIMLTAAFFPFNRSLILATGFISLSINLLSDKIIRFSLPDKIRSLVYKIGVLFVFVYNPLFYLGTFDSVEEGFWLGWLERLIKGQNIYSDFAAYHPPLILWGLSLFSKVFGYSMHNLRLYLHLLQIAGVIIIFFVLDILTKKPILKVLTMWLILSLLTRNVQNNAEIRLGLGLLATLPFYFYLKSKDLKLVFASGILTAISIFSSLEAGAVALASLAIGLPALTKNNFAELVKKEMVLFAGVLTGSLPVIIYLFSKNSLGAFFDQMFFYANSFSSGYLNTEITWPENLTLLQWFIVNKFANSTTVLLYITLGGILASALYYLYRLKIQDQDISSSYAGLLSLFAILMLKPILARSDGYHLLLVVPLSLILLTYVLDKIFPKNIFVPAFLIILIGMVFLRDATQTNFAQAQIIKFQTYGNQEGSYPHYNSGRTGILTGIEVNTANYDALITYLKTNTSDSDSFFVYPWEPEIYFLTDRKNPTSYDTPLAFFSGDYQQDMVTELEIIKVKYVVYRQKANLGGLNVGSLAAVNNYIKEKYVPANTFGEYQLLIRK